MNGQHFIIFFIFIVAFAGAQYPPRRDDLSAYCGLQHHDDYFGDTNSTTAIDEFPWVAGLIYQFFSDGAKGMLCAGALINRRYVVTAAQCLTHPQESALIAVRLGEYHIKNVTDCAISIRYEEDCSKAVDYGIEEKVIHAQYNREKRINDIALLRLDTRINEFTDYIRPICLEGNSAANIGDILYTSGWGRQAFVNEQTEFKKKVNTSLITNEKCAEEFAGRIISDTHICTRDLPKNAEFTCQGDAGGPVMFVTGSLRKWHLEGIASWGGQCGFVEPQVHTRVSKYMQWFKDNIRD